MNNDLAIMIVDDQALMGDALKAILCNLGFTNIFYAPNRETALNLFQSIEIDIVFMDINLDRHNGLKLIQEMLKIKSEFFPIIVSAESNIDNVREAIKIGVKSFIVKPFQPGKIKEVLKSFL